jgi:hypothetical protein
MNAVKKHHEPKYNIHELEKLIRNRNASGEYLLADVWERYLCYLYKYKKGLIENMPPEPNTDGLIQTKPYKRPLKYQGAGKICNPNKIYYKGKSLKKEVIDEDSELIEIERLNRKYDSKTEMSFIPIELEDYWEEV